ncbi:MAG: hypothetical protein HKO95_12395 [Rhodobacteraceae bacterium]|jgi:hypothetical protein|nr:hypothetical protein [Alphaproteobacteria bacterium]NNK67522.1 hypothetical protein [Paracoccaceae bacterium]
MQTFSRKLIAGLVTAALLVGAAQALSASQLKRDYRECRMTILIDFMRNPGETPDAYAARVEAISHRSCFEHAVELAAARALPKLERVRTPEGCDGKITVISNYEPTEADRAWIEMLNGVAAGACADEELWSEAPRTAD